MRPVTYLLSLTLILGLLAGCGEDDGESPPAEPVLLYEGDGLAILVELAYEREASSLTFHGSDEYPDAAYLGLDGVECEHLGQGDPPLLRFKSGGRHIGEAPCNRSPYDLEGAALTPVGEAFEVVLLERGELDPPYVCRCDFNFSLYR